LAFRFVASRRAFRYIPVSSLKAQPAFSSIMLRAAAAIANAGSVKSTKPFLCPTDGNNSKIGHFVDNYFQNLGGDLLFLPYPG
jgi:hypothetical protein